MFSVLRFSQSTTISNRKIIWFIIFTVKQCRIIIIIVIRLLIYIFFYFKLRHVFDEKKHCGRHRAGWNRADDWRKQKTVFKIQNISNNDKNWNDSTTVTDNPYSILCNWYIELVGMSWNCPFSRKTRFLSEWNRQMRKEEFKGADKYSDYKIIIIIIII